MSLHRYVSACCGGLRACALLEATCRRGRTRKYRTFELSTIPRHTIAFGPPGISPGTIFRVGIVEGPGCSGVDMAELRGEREKKEGAGDVKD